jgi:hypothetical protein
MRISVLGAGAALLAAGLSLALVPATAGAAGTARPVGSSAGGWTAIRAPLPSGSHYSGELASLNAVACGGGRGGCVAAGDYLDPSGHYQGMLVTGYGRHWVTARAPVPAGHARNPGVSLIDVTCGAPTSCLAVGDYTTTRSAIRGMLVTGYGRTWQTVPAPLPAGLAREPRVDLSTAACPSATTCLVTGQALNSDGQGPGLLLTWSEGHWTAVVPPTPAGFGRATNMELGPVACPTTAACVVVGSFTDRQGNSYYFFLTGLGSSWQATLAPVLPGIVNTYIGSLACPAVSRCEAVGSVVTSRSFVSVGQIFSGWGSSWRVIRAPAPAGSVPSEGTDLGPLACPTATWCVAAGSYGTRVDAAEGDVLTGTGPTTTGSTTTGLTWHAAHVALPLFHALKPNVTINAVACRLPWRCVAAGTYSGDRKVTLGLLLRGASWLPLGAPLPRGSADLAAPDLVAAACSPRGDCVVVGGYQTVQGTYEGLLLTGAPRRPAA